MVKKIYTHKNSVDYIKFGNGPRNLIVLPGLSFHKTTESEMSLVNQYKIFQEDYTVYFLDPPDKMKEGYTLYDFADDTAFALMRLGIRDAYFYGVSMGGMVAQIIAAEHPEMVRCLTLASTISKINENTEKCFLNWYNLVQKHDTVNLVSTILDDIYSKSYISEYKECLVQMFSNLSESELNRLETLIVAMLNFRGIEDASKIKCPCFVMGGEDDITMKIGDVRELAAFLNAEFYAYKGYAHSVYDEAGDFFERIIDFMKEK